jgi:hypothetical protein
VYIFNFTLIYVRTQNCGARFFIEILSFSAESQRWKRRSQDRQSRWIKQPYLRQEAAQAGSEDLYESRDTAGNQ